MAQRDLKTAPRDGTLIRLWLRDGGDFVGHYSDKWFGWVGLHALRRPARRAKRQTVIVVPATPAKIAEARLAKVINRIVRARKPRPR